jgi:hypothetical protein
MRDAPVPQGHQASGLAERAKTSAPARYYDLKLAHRITCSDTGLAYFLVGVGLLGIPISVGLLEEPESDDTRDEKDEHCAARLFSELLELYQRKLREKWGGQGARTFYAVDRQFGHGGFPGFSEAL